MFLVFCQSQPQLQLSPVPAVLGWDSINFNFSPTTPPPPHPPRESTMEDISSLWNHPWLLTSGPEPFDQSTFVHASFVHATSVRVTFVHATSVCATFFHTTFVQGLNHSCLDQTIKFQTSYKAKPTFVHATSVCATFVYAISVRATFFHTTFVQGQNVVVYNCNHSCLDQTIKF